MDVVHNLESADPIDLFRQWLAEAERSEPNDANAAALATSTPDGHPSVRMVLVKRADEHGFCFFTNAESRKGIQLHANPRAALCFHWKSLRRQVRVEGRVTAMPAADVDEYFHSPIPQQPDCSRRLAAEPSACQSRGTGYRASANLPSDHPGEVPRPPYWCGFCVHPEQIEFWISGDNRLHDRFLFTRDAGVWRTTRLYP